MSAACVVVPRAQELTIGLERLIERSGYDVCPHGQPPEVLAAELAHLVLGHDQARRGWPDRRREEAEAGAVAALVLAGWRSGGSSAPLNHAAPVAAGHFGPPDSIEHVFDASEAIL